MESIQDTIRAGARHGAHNPFARPAPAAPKAAEPKPAATSRAAKPFDFSTLKVEKGIPYRKRVPRLTGKWEPLFQMLAEPGDSTLVPADNMGGISAAILKRSRDKLPGVFKVSRVSKTEARVWRMS
ncbi:hypothetical protein RD110_15800 [Rhodoferax koreense]|uniref:Uncharacterized protein n=1 Tax=Rhodoferax koreensis TaxID=1842727 RepID=A0A1P8JXM8_9BURK|nr:hypothetical protein [Rhodoferax koreense]APW38485.1 hypothetical protein RD110_15800 [Rhodoferax koreense]